MNEMLLLAELLKKHRLETQEKDKRIAELEEDRDVRDLEQQAKGINDFKKWVLDTDENTSCLDIRDISLIEFYVEPLIRQAELLKEQGK